MSVKKEASGRRSVQVEVEVPGTPEEVWQAIATGPGISSWFVPAEFEERDGKPVAVKLNFGPGMESTFRRDGLGTAAKVGFPRPMAGSLARRPSRTSGASKRAEEASASSALSIASSPARTIGTTNWKAPNPAGLRFFRILRIYLTHFRGQRSAMMQWMAPAAGTEAEAWETLTAALGAERLERRAALDRRRRASRRSAAWWSTSPRVRTTPCCGSTSRGRASPPLAPSTSAARAW